MTQLYRMADDPSASKAAISVADRAEAKLWNTPEKGFGIFATVNTFDGPRRKEHLNCINAWPIDIDEGDKTAQAKRIMGAPLIPTLVVETKRGYQVYWVAKNGAKADHWNALVLERLVPYFGADKNARDLCRILRVPGFLHLKDAAAPFMCRAVWKHEVSYTERQLAEAFPWVPDPRAHVEQRAEVKRTASIDPGEDFWAAIGNLDCRDALERLSGSHHCNGERFTFRTCSNGNANILVDGKGSSCWVDKDGKIGSLDKGGPLITNWLRWYRNDWKAAIEAVKSIYPHIAEIDERNKVRERAEWVAANRRAA